MADMGFPPGAASLKYNEPEYLADELSVVKRPAPF
jgi:hypothetical protein